MKVLVVFGTRPEAIKMAPVIHALSRTNGLETKVCITAQHREMLDQALSIFGIQPDFDLNIMRPDQDLTDVTISVLSGCRRVLKAWRPRVVIVHGDTTTTLGASLAAYYEKIPVYHVEAGLRTHDIYSPWPEEINRRVAGLIAAFHFAPTDIARQNLLGEGIRHDNIQVTGNTVVDALKFVLKRLRTDHELTLKIHKKFSFIDQTKRIILVTVHRRENFGHGLLNICSALSEIGERNDVQIIFPVHLNPNVQTPVMKILSNRPNIHLIPPQDYLPFVYLIDRAHLILTDSGGIQEEASTLGKPVLVLRESTERPEAVMSGVAKIVGAETNNIINEVTLLLNAELISPVAIRERNPFGSGDASIIIAKTIIEKMA